MARTNESFGLGCLALFSLPFLGVGVLLLWVAYDGLREHRAMREWPRVPARLEKVELNEHPGGLRELSVLYRYRAGGEEHEGTRVCASDDATEFADHHEELERRRSSGEVIEVLVDPADPKRAVIYTDMPPDALILPGMAIVFGGAGAALFVGALIGIAGAVRRAGLVRAHPDRPWRHDGRWREFALRAGTINTVLALWGATVFFVVFMGIFVIALATDPGAPFFAKALIGFFCLIPLAFGYFAVLKTLQLVKFGSPTLHVARLPVLPAEPFEAAIFVGRPIDAREGVHLALRCEKATTTGSGKSRSTHTETLWEEKAEVREEDLRPGYPVGTIIPVRIRLPADLPETEQGGNPRFGWVLEARASGPGVGFEVSFDLPVYRVDAALVERRPDALPGA